jgi:hypothetical protein
MSKNCRNEEENYEAEKKVVERYVKNFTASQVSALCSIICHHIVVQERGKEV